MKNGKKTKFQPDRERAVTTHTRKQAARATPKRYLSPLRLLISTLVSILVAEVFVMFFLSILPPLSVQVGAFFDALLLTALVSPTLYLFLFRPLILHITKRKRAEEALQKAHDELEKRVEERTAELKMTNEDLRLEMAERKRAEEALRASHRTFEFLANFDELTSGLEVGTIIRTTLEFLRDRMGIKHSSIALLESARDGFRLIEVTHTTQTDFERGSYLPAQTTVISEIVKESQPRYRPDIEAENSGYDTDQKLLQSGLRSDFLVPLCFEQKCVGTLNVGSPNINAFTEADRQLITLLAPRLSQSLQNAELLNKSRKSEASLAEAQRIAHLGNWDLDIVNNKLHWSDEIYRIFGLTPQEFGATYDAFLNSVHPDDREFVKQSVSQALDKKKPYSIDHRIVLPDGTERIVHEQAEVTFEKSGKPIQMVGTVQDITERKRAEQANAELEAQLRQSQKMEAIGTLAGGIAHDFNNILTPILGYVDMVLQDVSPESQARADLEHVIKAVNRAKDLVKQILTFSRQVEQERKPVQIHLIIKEALKLLRASLPTTIKIRQNLDTKYGTVVADPTQIHQVVMNLCTNAYHAMNESGGVLEVRLGMVKVATDFVRDNPDLHEGTYVRLTVSDTGHGINRATMARIFEPFFTTRAVGEGTGLGLSVVHGIVVDHGGEITVESEPGKGTSFHVYLPLADSKVERKILADEINPRGKERILFVDDEEEIALMGKQMLERLGYVVTVRTNSVEALEKFRAQPERFDLVITDQTMPDMTGVELAGELLHIQPGIPIILMTGFSETATPETARNIGIHEYINKPVSAIDLGRSIRRALSVRSGG